MEKLNETIDNICDWVNDRLDDSLDLNEANAVTNMIFALAELVAATKETYLEKRIADLEGQVQSQQEDDINYLKEKMNELLFTRFSVVGSKGADN